MYLKITLIAFFSSLSIISYSQIETDRPDFTESPNTVPKKALQIETGYVHANENSSYHRTNEITNTVNTTLLRYGIGQKTELRLNWNYHLQRTTFESRHVSRQQGFAPFFVGVKHNLIKTDKVSTGVLAHLYVPYTASSDFQPTLYEFIPEFLVPTAIDLTDKFSIAIQLGMSWDGENYAPTAMWTLSLGYGITDNLSFYFEPYGHLDDESAIAGKDRRMNAGFTYLINDQFQIDISSGRDLSKNYDNHFISGGFSILFAK